MGKEGTVVSLVTPQKKSVNYYNLRKTRHRIYEARNVQGIICRNETESTKEKKPNLLGRKA